MSQRNFRVWKKYDLGNIVFHVFIGTKGDLDYNYEYIAGKKRLYIMVIGDNNNKNN